MPNVPTPGRESALSIALFANGQDLPGDLMLVSATIDQQVNTADKATFRFIVPGPGAESSTVLDHPAFDTGTNISLKAGYNFDMKTLFEGIVTSQIIATKEDHLYVSLMCKSGEARNKEEAVADIFAPSFMVEYGVDIMDAEIHIDETVALGSTARFGGYILFSGSADVSVTSYIQVNGLGKKLYHNPFISGVQHNIAEGAWTTKVLLGQSDG
jgi:hypothetical protein